MWVVKAPKQAAKEYSDDAFNTPEAAARAYALDTYAQAIRHHCVGNVAAPGPYSVVVSVSGPGFHGFVCVEPLVAFDAKVAGDAQ